MLSSNFNGTYSNRSIASNFTSSVPQNSSSRYDTLAQGYNPQGAMDVLDQKATNMYDGAGNYIQSEPVDKVEISSGKNEGYDFGTGWVKTLMENTQRQVDETAREAKEKQREADLEGRLQLR